MYIGLNRSSIQLEEPFLCKVRHSFCGSFGLFWFLRYSLPPANNVSLIYLKLDLQNPSYQTAFPLVFPATVGGQAIISIPQIALGLSWMFLSVACSLHSFCCYLWILSPGQLLASYSSPCLPPASTPLSPTSTYLIRPFTMYVCGKVGT